MYDVIVTAGGLSNSVESKTVENRHETVELRARGERFDDYHNLDVPGMSKPSLASHMTGVT